LGDSRPDGEEKGLSHILDVGTGVENPAGDTAGVIVCALVKDRKALRRERSRALLTPSADCSDNHSCYLL
jgi:hypothetical protein